MATENRDGLRRAIAAILEESPLALAELIERLDAGHLLEALLDRIGRDALTAVVSQEVFSIDQCWVTGSGVAGRTDALLDGLVLTHRLSEEEVTTERVRCWPDLVVLDWDADDGLELRTGGQLAVELEYRGTHRDGSVLCGPPGWLHDAGAGDLLAFVRSEDAVGVEVVGTAPSPDQREVAALRAGVESWLAAGEGDELAPMMIDALVLDPGSFRRAVRPLGELAVDAGLECRGFSFGRRGEHWSTRAERYEAEERREAAEGLASCCRERFEVLCDTFVAYRDGEDFDSGAIRSDLAHGDVLAAFANYAPSWDALLGFHRRWRKPLRVTLGSSSSSAWPPKMMTPCTPKRDSAPHWKWILRWRRQPRPSPVVRLTGDTLTPRWRCWRVPGWIQSTRHAVFSRTSWRNRRPSPEPAATNRVRVDQGRSTSCAIWGLDGRGLTTPWRWSR